jgi:hypothetical protein
LSRRPHPTHHNDCHGEADRPMTYRGHTCITSIWHSSPSADVHASAQSLSENTKGRHARINSLYGSEENNFELKCSVQKSFIEKIKALLCNPPRQPVNNLAIDICVSAFELCAASPIYVKHTLKIIMRLTQCMDTFKSRR